MVTMKHKMEMMELQMQHNAALMQKEREVTHQKDVVMQLKEEKMQVKQDLIQSENQVEKLRAQIATFMAAQPGQTFECLCKRCDAQFATAEDLRQHKHNCGVFTCLLDDMRFQTI